VGTTDPSSEPAALPGATRRLLLTAAAAAPEDLPLFLGGLNDQALRDWAPAEEAGLVRLDGTGARPLRWHDPNLPRALYAAATFVDRQRAHRALADALTARADRRAWHLAAATLGPDEQVAAALEDSADVARLHNGWAAAARMLERSADLSTNQADAARRYLLAMRAAIYAGDGTWVGRLGARAAELTDDPSQALEAALATGWSLARTVRHAEAVTLLTTVAVRAADAGNADLAWSALAPAAVAAYYSGHGEHRDQMLAAVEMVVRADAREADAGVGPPQATWLAASLDPVGSVKLVEAVLDAMGHPTGLDQVTLNQLGAAAWAVDRTEYAVVALRTFLERQEHTSLGGVNALVSNTLGTALRDSGDWPGAEAAYRDAVEIAGSTGMEMIRLTAGAELAVLAALRGDSDAARELAAEALAGLDTDASRGVGVIARRALGLAALVEGDHERAHDVLRLIVDDSGYPVHPHLSLFGMVDVVTASLRTGRYEAAHEVADAFRDVAESGSARLRMLVDHASALVAAAEADVDLREPEGRFTAALTGAEGATWPFDRARVHLDFGIWLRRQRRAAEARPHLVAAQDTFERVGAAPFAQRAAAELRAAGVRAAGTRANTMRSRLLEDDAEVLAGLTSQQREIVLLAAQGLTNREIGARLFVSPRTVGAHLYRAFPLLGVTSRTQLRDVVDARR
jgi:DNA-binding CsgD family transcriptional regulator/tetratricopeptide (TPR) repeat protein